jgi:hypothetical protein
VARRLLEPRSSACRDVGYPRVGTGRRVASGVRQLLVATAGLLLGFASITPGGRELVAKVPGTAALVNHFGTFRRAAVDAPGLAEGLGAFLAGSLYAGWFPLSGLPVAVRSLGLAMAVTYGWETMLQAVIHPGWYNLDTPPGRAMRVFRGCIFLTSVILC